MVTGQVPFEASNPSAVMRKHLTEDPTGSHINESLSSGFSEIIEVCMAKKAKKRYSTPRTCFTTCRRYDEAIHRSSRKLVDLSDLAALAPDETTWSCRLWPRARRANPPL